MAIADPEFSDEVVQDMFKDTFHSDLEKEQLEDTQELRRALIRKLAYDDSGQVKIPGPTSEKLLLTDLLNNHDKNIKDRAKLRIATKATDQAGINAAEIAQYVKTFRHGQDVSEPVTREQRELPSHIKVTPMPGEADIGVKPVTIHEILKDV